MVKKKVGILGGGQLAMLLTQAAKKAGIPTSVLCASNEPAYSSSEHKIVGSYKSLDDVKKLAESVDILTIESEFVDTALIESAIEGMNVQCLPHLRTIQIAQDKLAQKELFSRLHLPTAKYKIIHSEEVREDLIEALEQYPQGVMLKWSKFGYDGKGNFLLKDESQMTAATEFCQRGYEKKARVYAEELISFEKECAMIFVRSRGGKLLNYPLVLSEQENSVCKIVQGPATALGVSFRHQGDAIEMGRAIGDAILVVGTFALEFFYSASRGLMINEMAPRVHNSGHYSIDAANTSQFESHLKSIVGEPNVAPETTPFFAMLNLLGPEDRTIEIKNQFVPPTPLNKSMTVCWYNKTRVEPRRKMGHINVKANTLQELFSGINEMKLYEETLWQKLSSQ